jgi:hypothetical protein
MIDLQVKNKQGEWISLDLTTLDVPINLQVNQIAELKDRQAGYSQSIKLPMTRKNLEVLNLPNRIDAVGGMQYEIVECLMYAGSFELVGIGGNMVIKSVTNVIDVQILFGNSDLFTKLQNTLFSETDLGWYKHGYRFFQYPTNSNYAMPCASFVKEGKDYSIKTGYSESYPFIYFKNAVEKVLQHHGFTLSTDIDTGYFERLAINCNKGFDEIVDNGQTNLKSNYAGSAIGSATDVDLSFVSGVISLYYNQDNIAFPPLTVHGYEYILMAGEVVDLKFTFTDTAVVKHINIRRYTDDGYGTFSQIRNQTITGASVITNSITGVDDYSIIRIEITRDVSAENLNFDLEISSTSFIYAKNLSSTIDINTQLDLIKMFVNEFALTVNVDNDNKVMHAYSMNKLYQSFDDAKDWSKKLDFGKEQQIDFIFSDYAQSNYIRLQDNEDDQVKKSFEFNIANDNLAKRKDLFEMPFCATKKITTDNQTGGDLTCSIPMVSKSDEGELSFSGGKLHLVYLFDDTFDVYPITACIDAFDSNLFSIRWEQPIFTSMLTDVKYVTAYFNLTDEDIANYDPFIPVYISYFGQYFYINKIVNYVTGKLTKVELLKL